MSSDLAAGRVPGKVLAISSQVVYGAVGNSAAVPAMQILGVSVLALPTVILSNHPGLGPPVRQQTSPETLGVILNALASEGRLDDLAAIMSGYFTDAAQVETVAAAISGLKAARSGLLYLCDPILGDDPGGLYIPQAVAEAIRSRLVPLADLIMPNRFELAWLSGREVAGPSSAVDTARRLAPVTLASSIPLGADLLASMVISREAVWLAETRRRALVPHGTGDLLAGLFCGHLTRGRSAEEALRRAVGGIEAVLDLSEGQDTLNLAEGLAAAAVARPWPVRIEITA